MNPFLARRPRAWGLALTLGLHAGLLLAGLAALHPPSGRGRAAPALLSVQLLAAPAPASQHNAPVRPAAAPTLAPPAPLLPPAPPQITVSALASEVPAAATAPAIATAPPADIPAARPGPLLSTSAGTPALPSAPSTERNDDRPASPADRACADRQMARHYPQMLRERGIEGRVLLRVRVDERGQPAEVLVQGGSGWRLLDEAARALALGCPYVAASRGGHTLASWIEYPVRFALNGSAAAGSP